MEQGESVLIAGGTGLIGDRLCQILTQNGYRVMLLSRKKHKNGNIPVYEWNVEQGTIDENAILRADYIINLAGAGIADKRWSAERKKHIIESRTQSAALLFDTCKRLNHFPKAYLSASAIGYYGDRGNDILDEEDEAGKGFLSESCTAWENAAQIFSNENIRTVVYRIGIVLSTQGGALVETIKPMRLGLCSYFGNGRQYFSWVHIDDICNMILRGLEDEDMSGTFNAVAPNPSSNKEFSKTLRKCYPRFTVLAPVPTFMMRLIMGEMADIVLTSSIVSSAKIEQQGFVFQYPELEMAFKDVLFREI